MVRYRIVQTWDTAKRPRLVGLWALCVIGVAIAVALIVALPVRLPIQQPNFDGENGALSVAYLQAAVRNDPDDRSGRLNLVHQLLDLGRLDEAQAMLEPLKEGERPPSLEVAWLEAQILEQQVLARDPGSTSRESLRRALVERVEALQGLDLTVDQQDHLARLALSLERPALAARYFELTAARSEGDRAARLALAANRHRAAGDAAEAVALYWQVADGEDPALRLVSAVSILDLQLAAGDLSAALDAATELASRLPDSPEVLQRAVEAAAAAGEAQQALTWAEQWLALQPDEGGPPDPLPSGGSQAEPSTPDGDALAVMLKSGTGALKN